MKLLNFLIVLLVAIFTAGVAGAVDTTTYPSTLIDSTCTDAKDTVGGFGFRDTFVENVTGSGANGQCDHDNRILTGAITADKTFGPLSLQKGKRGIIIFADADVISNDTDTWRMELRIVKPHDKVKLNSGQTASFNTETDKIIEFGPDLYVADPLAGGLIDAFVPDVFFLFLNLQTATSWAGDISWISY